MLTIKDTDGILLVTDCLKTVIVISVNRACYNFCSNRCRYRKLVNQYAFKTAGFYSEQCFNCMD